MTKTLRICGQFAFVIILDLLVIGYIFLASEQKKAFDANAKSAEIIPAKLSGDGGLKPNIAKIAPTNNPKIPDFMAKILSKFKKS